MNSVTLALYALGLGVANLLVKRLVTDALTSPTISVDSSSFSRVAFFIVVIIWPLLDEVLRLVAILNEYQTGWDYTLFMAYVSLSLGLSIEAKAITKVVLGFSTCLVQWICFVILAKHISISGLLLTSGVHAVSVLAIVSFCEWIDLV
ncbi:MAG: hypothetical protein DRG30_09810 [Epsilonproteobacteria bacterium]|nr:MAG: hypothetical protein DRG30_09810 [Campylobacterota bacterium]